MKIFKLFSPFYVVIMPGKTSNVPSNIVFFTIIDASLRIARATNNPSSFSTAIELLITLWAGIRFPLKKTHSLKNSLTSIKETLIIFVKVNKNIKIWSRKSHTHTHPHTYIYIYIYIYIVDIYNIYICIYIHTYIKIYTKIKKPKTRCVGMNIKQKNYFKSSQIFRLFYITFYSVCE